VVVLLLLHLSTKVYVVLVAAQYACSGLLVYQQVC
jgi:hypothetical protein